MYRHLTDDVVVMAANAPPLRGSEVIVIAGDCACDRGTGREILTPKNGGTPFGGETKYLWVYRRVGRTWKQARVIWNSSEPPPGAPAQSTATNSSVTAK